VPNGYGALSGIAQLVLYAIYKNATPLSLVLKQQEAALNSKVIGVDDYIIEDDPSLNLKPPKQIFTTPAEQHEVNIISFDDSSVNLKPPAKQITSSSPEQQVKSLTDDCNQKILHWCSWWWWWMSIQINSKRASPPAKPDKDLYREKFG